jgi:single-strand DNA-binding protein
MVCINRTFLLGNLTREPETITTKSGHTIAKFGMAMNRQFVVNGEKRQETCFVDVVAFGRTAEVIAQYCRKGQLLFIEGRLDYQTWEKDGQTRSKLQVVVDTFQLMPQKEGRSDGGGGGGGRSNRSDSRGRGSGPRQQELDPVDPGDDDIPF